MADNDVKTVRCAIYTRKSTDEGLQQEFNSLDAQRESAEAYIASQKHEGWQCIPRRYDDGGFSGGNTERPAFKRLMADVEAGKIDCVIVYKIDRLSRSLLDFSRIMELFEKRGVSLVSVTQQFNTTSSMGRLTLNILFSFAQFEREIISERTRDKMSAARRKGKWTGGNLVLGYDVDPKGGRLLVNEAEAKRVRAIFELYLQHEALMPMVRELKSRGWHTKQWITKKGHKTGGRPFDKPTLHNLLRNVIYTGRINHKGAILDGEHPAIVDTDVFERVQATFASNGRSGGVRIKSSIGGILKGLIHCKSCDCAMVHTHTKVRGIRYRYYSCGHAMKNGNDTCPARSVPAQEIENFVVEQIRQACTEQEDMNDDARAAILDPGWSNILPDEQSRVLRQLIESVTYDARDGSLSIEFLPDTITAPEGELQEISA